MSLLKLSTKSLARQRAVSTNLLQYANESRSEGHFNDVTIIAGNLCIPGNRMVLSCHSVFFEKMFKCEMREKYEHNVEIKSLDGKSVKSLIEYIYVGSIDIDEENVMKLLAAADYLQLHDVKQFCFEFLESNISIDNWFDILQAVMLYRGDEIKDQVCHYISTHFEEIAQTEHFKELHNDDLIEWVSNLNQNEVKARLIYRGIMVWIKHDPEARKDEMFNLFRLLKFDQLPYEFIEEALQEDLIKNNADCHSMLVTTLSQILMYGSKLISVGGVMTLSKVTEVYNLQVKPFDYYPDFPVNICYHSLIKVKGYVYCIGGDGYKEGSEVYNNVRSIYVKDQFMYWEEIAPMNERRRGMGATEHNGALVVAGGNDGLVNLASVEFYEMQLNDWNRISPMNQVRCLNALVSCKGCLYALGGSHGVCFSSVEKLSDLEGRWEESRPMQQPRILFAAVNCDNFIYAIGGQTDSDVSSATKTVEKFDPDHNEWVYVSDMNISRSFHAACVLHGKIYVVGGLNSKKKTVKWIECYDPSLNIWSIVGKINDTLVLHSIVSL